MAYLTNSEIYKRQNRVIHKACSRTGVPYGENKACWNEMLCVVAERKVSGLTELTLGERREVIESFNRGPLFQGKKKLYNPYVNRYQRDWKKGEPETLPKNISRPIDVGPGKKPLVSKIHAVLADLKLPWSYADAIAQTRFDVSVVEFLNMGQLGAVVKMLVIHQNRQRNKK